MTRVGIGSFIGWGEQSAYNTGVASTKFAKLKAGDEDFGFEEEVLRSGQFTDMAMKTGDFAPGAIRVNRTYGYDLRFGGGWGVHLEHACQNRFTTTGASDPYTHTLEIGNHNTALSGKALSFVVFKDGIRGVAADRAFRYFGCRPTSAEFTFEPGIARVQYEILGANLEFITKETPSYTTEPLIVAPSSGSPSAKSLKFGTDGSEVEYTCRKMSIKIEFPHAEERDLHKAIMEEPLPSEGIKITGSAEVRYPGAGTDGGAFHQAYLGKDFNSLVFALQGSSADKSIEFDFHNALIVAPVGPNVGTAGALYQTLEFEGAADSSNPACTMTLKNGDSAIF